MISRKRMLTALLCTALTVTSLPVGGMQVKAEETQTPLLAEFDFATDAVDGVLTGGNAKATVKGGASLVKTYGTDKALYLDGTDSWINVKKSDGTPLLTGVDEFTVSYDAKVEKGNKSWSFFAAPDDGKQSYQNEHYIGMLHTTGGITAERYNNAGSRPGNSLTGTSSKEWMHVALVVESGHTTLYVNGEKASESDSSYSVSKIVGETGVVQIGKANWDDGEFYKGYLDNFKIYGGVATADELAADYAAFQAFTEELNKPVSPEELLAEAKDALDIPSKDDIRNSIGLIKEGKNGVTISWESSNPDVVSDTPVDEDDIYDGGIVKRPEAGENPVKVTLTATLSLEGTTDVTKEFELTVTPKTANVDSDYSAGYLWTNFDASGGYEKIFYGYSEDGLSWDHLNKKNNTPRPILVNDAEGSDLGVRDPHVIRSVDGDKYWILGTDLHAEGGGAGGSGWNQLSASQNLVVWESNDLVNWSEPMLVYAGFDTAGCIWAPEAIYDETKGDYVVYWSARDYSKNGTDENALRVYVCRTRDFQSFTEPKIWLSEDQDSGSEVNIIDTTIVKGDDGKFYRFSTSDWNTVVDVSDTLDIDDVFDVRNGEEASTPNGSWTRIVKRGDQATAGFTRSEGYTVYKLPDGKWCAMGDNGGYKAFVTDDLASGVFEEGNASFVKRFRHGTVMRLSKTEEARVLEAFGNEGGSSIDPDDPADAAKEPILEYTFENDVDTKVMTDTGKGDEVADNGTLLGNATIEADEDLNSNVLYLDGSSGTYAQFPTGFFDEKDVMTISMDVKSQMSSGNFFTFTYGKNNTVYDFLRIRGSEVRNAITVNSYSNESEVKGTGAGVGEWQKVVLVVKGTTMKLYIDGSLVSTNNSTGVTTSDLGTDLLAYLGKSMYSGDGYFKGSFDNIQIYNRALSDQEILDEVIDKAKLIKSVQIGTVPKSPSSTTGTDDHTAVTAKVDTENKTITSYLKKTADISKVPVTINALNSQVAVTMNGKPFVNGTALDLTKDVKITVKFGDRTEEYTIKRPKLATNAVLPGQYADPDIDYFQGKYWIYPTTDGVSGWGGTVFHAWSSTDMVNWEDEGIILDVADKDPGKNSKGVQIAVSEWSDGNAWAPSIEEKDGKYYFYYCGKVNSDYSAECTNGKNGDKAIGVAAADNPAGPFVAEEYPIVDPVMASKASGGFSGQVIDPSIFTDDDGTSYLFFGNGGGGCSVARLNPDMISIDESSIVHITGMTEFRESVVVTKREGIYHFTWSCDDTGSPNYHVKYGVLKGDDLGEALDAKKVEVEYKYVLIQKDEANSMLGTAHQSVLYMPKTDKCYLAYHRFYTPLGVYTDGFGYHRETCIDEITFDEDGFMKPMVPTMKGVNTTEEFKDPVKPVIIPKPTPTTTPVEKPLPVNTVEKVDKVAYTVVNADAASPEVAFASTNKKASKVTIPATVTIKGVTYKVTAIANNAFKGNTKLKSITIPAGIKTIGKNAFYGCKNLKKITIKSTSITKVGSSAFKKINAKATIKVPKAKKKAYTKLFKKKGQAKTVKIK